MVEPICQRAPPVRLEVELQLPVQKWEVVLFSAAIKCAMYYVACLENIHAIKLILLSIV